MSNAATPAWGRIAYHEGTYEGTDVQEEETQARIDKLRSSFVPDVYRPEEFIPWTEIEREIDRLRPAIDKLQNLIKAGQPDTDSLQAILVEVPSVLELVHLLLVAPGRVGFADGRELPPTLPSDGDHDGLAILLEDLGLWRLVTPDSDVLSLARIGALANDARRRGHRRSVIADRNVQDALMTAIETLRENQGLAVSVATPAKEIRARVDATLELDGVPFAAVASVFQAASGGAPARVLGYTYPQLQERLDKVPMALIVIADGRGVAEAPDGILRTLITSVADCMSLQEAYDGRLAEAIFAAATQGGLRAGAVEPVDEIISRALRDSGVVTAESLPVPPATARLAIAAHVRAHPELDLQLSAQSDRIEWARKEVSILLPSHREDSQEPISLINSLAQLLSTTELTPVLNERSQARSLLSLNPSNTLPSQLLVHAQLATPADDDLRQVSRDAMQLAPGSRYSVILTENVLAHEAAQYNRVQRSLAVGVIVLDRADLLTIAQGADDPRVAFARHVLAQSDLTKVSPFVVRSATPQEMFYGREAEEAALAGAVGSQSSVALLGGRRIGKTSLLRATERRLIEAGHNAVYLDCQTVRTWRDFGELTAQRLDISVPLDFRPSHLFAMMDTIGDRAAGAGTILMLDEIDQLLAWDEEQKDGAATEAFFRTCRSMSQDGAAQFVFSGERTISRKMWDPQSPHWNFCQPIQLRQLAREATERLVLESLGGLGVRIVQRDQVAKRIWQYTSGHPQIAQYLGDRLVQLLNELPGAERDQVDEEMLVKAASTYDFRDHYLETYWGQATEMERTISILVAKGVKAESAIRDRLDSGVTNEEFAMSIRMLELYGIISRKSDQLALRAEWFSSALGGQDG